MHHYESLKKTYDSRLRQFPCIEKLFDLPVGYAYQLMETQQKILNIISGKKDEEEQNPSRIGAKRDINSRATSIKVKRYAYKIIDNHDQYS